jgi:hypothetical protein
MRVSGLWSLLGAIVTALVIADLWTNSKVTDSLISAGTSESSLIAGKG